jgi:pimeloyl-ACP methyl ester carboxylesterase
MIRYGSVSMIIAAAAACASSAARVESGTLPVPGGELYYEVAGSGDPVVLIHGGFGDRRMWDDQFDVLARDYRVLRYDHRGFGRSPAPDTTYSPIRDLLQLLDRAEMDRAHLVGNSLGGALAITFALLHPERVRSLTVVASGADGFRYPQSDIEAITEVVALMRGGKQEEALTKWLANPMLAVVNTQPEVREEVERMVRENAGIWTMPAWPQQPLTPPARERLGRIRIPTLVVIGDRDARSVRTFGDSTARMIPGAERVVMTGTDHLPHMERPEEFNRLLVAFLRKAE